MKKKTDLLSCCIQSCDLTLDIRHLQRTIYVSIVEILVRNMVNTVKTITQKFKNWKQIQWLWIRTVSVGKKWHFFLCFVSFILVRQFSFVINVFWNDECRNRSLIGLLANLCPRPPHSGHSGLWRRSAPPHPPVLTALSPLSLQSESWHSAQAFAAWSPARMTDRRRCTPGQVRATPVSLEQHRGVGAVTWTGLRITADTHWFAGNRLTVSTIFNHLTLFGFFHVTSVKSEEHQCLSCEKYSTKTFYFTSICIPWKRATVFFSEI